MSLVQIEVCRIDLSFFHFSHGDVLLLDSRIEMIILFFLLILLKLVLGHVF